MNREKTITRVGIVGILANLVLVGFKATIGLLANSISIISDAINNLTDALFPEIYTNISKSEILSLIPKIASYSIVDSKGWPYETRGITLNRSLVWTTNKFRKQCNRITQRTI